jgi:hypothetical protein
VNGTGLGFRIARVVVDAEDHDTLRHADLHGGEPCAVGGLHRLEEIANEFVQLGRIELGHGLRDLAESRVAKSQDRAN